MITKKTATLVVVLGSLAVWLAAAATSGGRPVKPAIVVGPRIELRGEALAAEIDRLHDRLRPTAVPEHARNLFVFAAPRPVDTRAAALAAAATTPVIAAPAPAAPVEPPFKLIGIAEDKGVRTAIFSSSSQLFMVKDGELVSAYRVTRILAEAVELTATADGAVLRLALK